ncbi:MAG: PPOX class F420-dependent oxidoreductase, partial [Acidimicrobiales bacterium]
MEIAPSTLRGNPTGTAVRGVACLLHDEEDRHARQVIAHKYPLLQKFVIPLWLRLSRYTTMHYEVSLTDPVA